MASLTHPRGGEAALWMQSGSVGAPRLRAASQRSFAFCLAVAVALHAGLVGGQLVGWLRDLFDGPSLGQMDGDTLVPLDLDLLDDGPSLEGDKLGDSRPGAGAKPAPPPPSPGLATSPVASAVPPPPATASASAPAVSASAPPPPPPGPKVREPVAAAGGPGKLAKDPNVQILFSSDVLRKHPTAEGFGRVLRTIPEWKQFLAGTNLDPIQDFDHVLLAAPQLAGDSSKAVVVLDYRASDEAMRATLDQVVAGAKGTWLADAPVPTARARVQGADRLFAHIAQKNLVAILPDGASEQLSKLPKMKGFSKSGRAAMVISIVTPHRPFGPLVPTLPRTFKWMRVEVRPAPGGDADVILELADASPEEAAKHVEAVTSIVEKVRTLDIRGIGSVERRVARFAMGGDPFEPVEFKAERDIISGKARVTAKALSAILRLAETLLQRSQGE